MTIQLPARGVRASVITTVAAIVVAGAISVAAPVAAADPSPVRTLAQGVGMAGQPSVRVRQLQRALLRRGYDIGAAGADGRFGPRTAAAVRRVQAARGLAVDGVVGRRTRRALGLGRRPSHSVQRSAPKRAVTAPSSAPPAARPAPAPAIVRTAHSSFGAIAVKVMIGVLLASIAAFALAAALRRARRARRTRVRALPTDRVPTPPLPQRLPDPFIGYVALGPGTTAAEHDRSSAAIVAACREADRDLLEIVCDSADGRALERPGLTHALGRIADGEARGLVVSDVQGFSRSSHDVAALIEWLRDADATLVALDLGFDTATPEGRQAAEALVARGHAAPEVRRRVEPHRRQGARHRLPPLEIKG
jgi:peptidoglycan hydrolase-like protein with peptidoglycan-binding domain